MSSRVDVPLEYQDASFGELDDEQKYAIKKDALDLVLLENASELARLVMMEAGDGKHIERVLAAISKSNGCMTIPSQTFPIWMDPKTSRKESSNPKDSEDDEILVYDDSEYTKLKDAKQIYTFKVKSIQKQVELLKRNNKKGCIFSVFALDLGKYLENDLGGHYAAFYYDIETKEVDVFDSMQQSDKGSVYTPFFRQLGAHIFNVSISKSNITKTKCFNKELSLQFTGGFSSNPSVMVDTSEKRLTITDKKNLNIQSTESQNHFCYIWSIWFIHLKLRGFDVCRVAKELREKKVDPLVVIKRYMWALFHLNLDGTFLINEIPTKHRKFFNHNFLAVWTNDPERIFKLNHTFNRYAIPGQKAKTIDECLAISLRSEKLTRLENPTSTDAMDTF